MTLTPTVCWKFLRARYVNIPTSITDIKLICRFGVIREEVAIICVRNFLLTEGKVYKFMFMPVLFCLVLMFLLIELSISTVVLSIQVNKKSCEFKKRGI